MIKGFFEEVISLFVELLSTEEAWVIILVLGLGGLLVLPALSFWGVLGEVVFFLTATWWLWLFLILLPIIEQVWLHWHQEVFKSGIEWMLLELHMPRIVDKSPRAMEQVLQSLHVLRNAPGNFEEKYLKGEITVPFSLEIVSFGGSVHFYVRGQKKQRNLIEAAFFSYYPNLEITEVEDYVAKLPPTLGEMYQRGSEMWGAEMLFAKESAYPIKSYHDFEHEAEDKAFDPIATFLELLGKLRDDEFVGIHLIIAPADPKWREKFTTTMEKLRKPSTTKMKGSKDEGDREVALARTPGQTGVLEAVETNLSKQAFETLIRLFYTAPQGIYNDSLMKGLSGTFNQYSTLDLNAFKGNKAMSTRASGRVYTAPRGEYRKQRMLWNFLRREVPPETWWGKLLTSYPMNSNFHSKRFLMTTEGIATLFHPPTASVLTAPHIKRVESRKAGPPAGLAIFGDEEEIKPYQ